MTPAERFAKHKPMLRGKRNGPPTSPRRVFWVCTIRELRESLRISLRDVARACKMGVPTLWMIEMGGDVRMTTARKLADFFGRTVEELWPKRKGRKT